MRRNQETTSRPEKQRRQVSRSMKLLAGGAALLAAGCSANAGHDSAPKPKAPIVIETTIPQSPSTTPNTTKPEAPNPVQGDGNTANDMKAAEDAAWAQLEQDDSAAASKFLSTIDTPSILAVANVAVDKAEAQDAAWAQLESDDSVEATRLLGLIGDPSVKTQATHAVDAARVADAAWAQLDGDDNSAANVLLGQVSSPDLQKTGSEAVAIAKHQDDLWNNGNPASTTDWYDAKTQATNAWYDAKTEATNEWYDAKTAATNAWYDIHHQNSPDA